MGQQYTAEYKREAVKLVKEGGLSLCGAARELGVAASTLCKWVKDTEEPSPDSLTINEKEELKVLRKEVKRLRMERDILKKATAYFAKVSE